MNTSANNNLSKIMSDGFDDVVNELRNGVSENYDEPTHIYIDGNYCNNNFTSTTGMVQYVPAEIVQNRSSPFLFNPCKYNLTVARFSISSDSMVRVHQPLATSATGTVPTTWWVSLSYNSVYYDQPVIIPIITDVLGNSNRVCYSINGFMDIINSSFAAAQAAMISGGGPSGPGTGTVNMSYDPVSGLYAVNVPVFFGTGTVGLTGSGVGVHMSYQLYKKFQSFNAIITSPIPYNHHDVVFIRSLNINNYITSTTPGLTGPYMQLLQDKSWPSSIMDIHRLVISSKSLPVYSEYIGNTNAVQGLGGNGSQTFPIISDFLIGHDTELQSLGENYIYVPNLYRLCSLAGNNSLTQWDIKVYVADTFGNFYPLYLLPGDELSIKLLFLKRPLTA